MLLGYSLVGVLVKILSSIPIYPYNSQNLLFFHPQFFCQVAHMTAYDLKKNMSYKTSPLVPIL